MHFVLYLVVVLFASAWAAPVPQSLRELSPDDHATLEQELVAWKTSRAGQDSVSMGLLPLSTGLATARVTDNELQRWLNAKKTVQKLQEQHPQTIFSVHTPFALLTPTEFAAFVSKSNVPRHLALVQNASATSVAVPRSQVPDSVDWQQAGCVSRVKNQHMCGACWAFAAVGALEGGMCATSANRALHVLSEQDIVSCNSKSGSCAGGSAGPTLNWLLHLNGNMACTEQSVPYASSSGVSPMCTRLDDANAPCDRVDLGLATFRVDAFASTEEMEMVVASRPIASFVHAGVPSFQYYSGGVLMGNNDQCPSTMFDHEVTTVGYGERDGTKYWKIKNSWGDGWGENGYVYLQRGYDGSPHGTCGIETWGVYPIFRSEQPLMGTKQCTSARQGVQLIGTLLHEQTVVAYDGMRCCDLCRERPSECKGVTWSNDADGETVECSLFAAITGETYNTTSRTYSTTLLPTADVHNLMCLPLENNIDYVGNNYDRALTTTAGECCDVCSQDPNCNAYTWTKWMNGSCFLKTAKTTTKLSAPLPDGTPYTQSGEIYRCQPLQQNIDLLGEDLSNVPAKTARECCPLCRRTTGCKAFSWSAYQGGTCWLKGKVDITPVAGPGVISAAIY